MDKENKENRIITSQEVDRHKWGYIVCLGTVVTFIAAIGHINSFGLIYNDFVKVTHSSSKSITTAHGVFAMMLAVGGTPGDAQEHCELATLSSGEKRDDDKMCEKNTLWAKCQRFSIVDFLNLKLFDDLVYCNICIGQSFVNFSDLIFFILQPMLLFQKGFGFTKSEAAACISIAAGADVAGRCLMVVISSFVTVNTRLLFFVATIFTMVGRIVMLHITGFASVAAVTALLGLLRAWLHIASPLVIADRVSKEDFPGAYGLFLLTAGLVSMICNPIIGIVKDVYADYTPAFYGLVACCLPCVVLWPVEYFLLRRKDFRIQSEPQI